MSKTATRSALKNAIQAANLQGQIDELRGLLSNGHSVAQTTVAEVVKRPVGRPRKVQTEISTPVITMRFVPRNGKDTNHDLFEVVGDGGFGKLYLPIGTTSVTIKLVRS